MIITYRGRLSFSGAEEGPDAGAGTFSADAAAASGVGKARRKFEQVKLCVHALKCLVRCCSFHGCVLQCIAIVYLLSCVQESEADFERLVAAPLLQVISDARSKNRDQSNSSSADATSNIRSNAHAAEHDGGAADRHYLTNPTLLVGGEYKPLGPISECLDVDEIEQVLSSSCQLEHRLSASHFSSSPRLPLFLLSACGCPGVAQAAQSSISAAFCAIWWWRWTFSAIKLSHFTAA